MKLTSEKKYPTFIKVNFIIKIFIVFKRKKKKKEKEKILIDKIFFT